MPNRNVPQSVAATPAARSRWNASPLRWAEQPSSATIPHAAATLLLNTTAPLSSGEQGFGRPAFLGTQPTTPQRITGPSATSPRPTPSAEWTCEASGQSDTRRAAVGIRRQGLCSAGEAAARAEGRAGGWRVTGARRSGGRVTGRHATRPPDQAGCHAPGPAGCPAAARVSAGRSVPAADADTHGRPTASTAATSTSAAPLTTCAPSGTVMAGAVGDSSRRTGPRPPGL